MYIIGFFIFHFLMPMAPIFLDFIVPLNETRPRYFPLKLEILVDQNDHVTLVFMYSFVVVFLSMTINSAVDSIYSTQLHYACAILAEIS